MPNKINELLDSNSLGSALLRTDGDIVDTNFYYFSGLSKTSKSSSFLILRRSKKPVLITSVLEYGGLRESKNLHIVSYNSHEALAKLLRKNLTGRVGINYSYYTLSGYKKLRRILPGKRFADVSGQLSKMREIKTNGEIKKISHACKITEAVLKNVPDIVKIGMTEKNLANELEYIAKQMGCEALSFPPIVAVGGNASVPHHATGRTKISKGKILLIDFGIVCGGYCSDLTRTFFVGKASEETKHIYDIVYCAQRTAIKNIKDGAKSSDVFKIASDILKKDLGQGLIHGLGHGIGIDVHDFPAGMSDKFASVLKENMCLTVEPGYYKGRIGIRIEDDVVVKKNDCRLLSNAPKELVEV